MVPSFAHPPGQEPDAPGEDPRTPTNTNDNENPVTVNDADSSCCSVAKFGSRASSQTSIPGLDWDSQVKGLMNQLKVDSIM